MSSLLTNASAMTALRVLTSTQKALTGVQDQVSTGLRVSDASDNAAYWSIGVGMKSQTGALGAVNDSLNLSNSLFSVTSAALGSILTSLNKMKDDVVAAQQPGVSLEAVQSDIEAQQKTIIAVANSASFNGVNLLLSTVETHVDEVDTIHVDTTQAQTSSIVSGSSPNNSLNFYGSQTVTTVQTIDGETGTQTVTDSYNQTWSDAADGTVSMSSSTNQNITGRLPVRNLSVPLSYSAAEGLVTSSLQLDKINLFSAYTNGFTQTTKAHYDGDPDIPDVTSTSSGPVAYSYETSSGSGILDPSMTLVMKVDPSNAPAGGSSSSGSTPMAVNYTGITAPSSGGASSSLPPSTGLDPSERVVQASILNVSVIGATGPALTTIGQFIDKSIAGIVNASAVVGRWQNQVGIMQSFNSALSDALTSGVGSLVDADMNVASTRLQALQTQQQLGIQALSIANDNSKEILKLFG